MFDYAGKSQSMHGGKLYENIVQNFARLIIFDVAMRMRRRYPKVRLALQVHDELVYVVPNPMVAEFKQALVAEMNTPPGYAEGLPLSCEPGQGPTYGDAK
jgi:DNA polymerase I-like protein with 3'-5' exonuclease and polymerase domains